SASLIGRLGSSAFRFFCRQVTALVRRILGIVGYVDQLLGGNYATRRPFPEAVIPPFPSILVRSAHGNSFDDLVRADRHGQRARDAEQRLAGFTPAGFSKAAPR